MSSCNVRWNRQRAVGESQTRESSGGLDRGAAKWIALANYEGTRVNRRHALRWWLVSNGLWTSLNPRLVPPASRPEYWQKLIPEVDATVSKIRSGRLDPYGSVNKLIDYMKKRNKSISCTVTYRGTILKFLRYCQVGVTDEGGRDYVKRVRRIHLLNTKLPTADQIRGILLAAPLKAKVLISTMISTGGRLNEILNLRQDDLDLTRKPAIAYLRGETTKTGDSRITFLSSETVMLILNYLKSREGTHQFLFDGYDPTTGTTYDIDKPMSKCSAWDCLRRAFSRIGLNNRSPQGRHYYHSNTFRALSLAIMKTGGYPADWAEHLIGHFIGTQQSYIPPTDTLGQEWLKIDHRFCFLGDPQRNEGTIPDSSLGPNLETQDLADRTQRTEAPASPTAFTGPVQLDESVSTTRWASKSYYYVKTSISSSDYDQALADGYTVFDRDGSLRVLRKRGNHLHT